MTDGVLELAGTLSLVDVRSDYRAADPRGRLVDVRRLCFRRAGPASARSAIACPSRAASWK